MSSSEVDQFSRDYYRGKSKSNSTSSKQRVKKVTKGQHKKYERQPIIGYFPEEFYHSPEFDEMNPYFQHDDSAYMKMAVLPKHFPRICINTDQAKLIKHYLLYQIDNIPLGKASPKFGQYRHKYGFLSISCFNDKTKSWLEEIIKYCVPWKGANLKVIPFSDLPKFATFWVPGSLEDPKKILHRLKIQNSETFSNSWRIIDQRIEENGQKITITMDETAWGSLQMLGFVLHLNFSKIFLQPECYSEDIPMIPARPPEYMVPPDFLINEPFNLQFV